MLHRKPAYRLRPHGETFLVSCALLPDFLHQLDIVAPSDGRDEPAHQPDPGAPAAPATGLLRPLGLARRRPRPARGRMGGRLVAGPTRLRSPRCIPHVLQPRLNPPPVSRPPRATKDPPSHPGRVGPSRSPPRLPHQGAPRGTLRPHPHRTPADRTHPRRPPPCRPSACRLRTWNRSGPCSPGPAPARGPIPSGRARPRRGRDLHRRGVHGARPRPGPPGGNPRLPPGAVRADGPHSGAAPPAAGCGRRQPKRATWLCRGRKGAGLERCLFTSKSSLRLPGQHRQRGGLDELRRAHLGRLHQ